MFGKRFRVLAVVLALCMFVGCMTYAEVIPTAAPEVAAVETQQPVEAEAPATDAPVETQEEPATEATEEPAAEATEEPVTEATEEPAAETTEEPAAETTEEPATEATEEPATEATVEPAAEATEEPAPVPEQPETEAPAVDGEAESPVEALALEEAAEEEAPAEACAHAHVLEWDYFDGEEEYTPKDSKFHTITGHMRHEKVCNDCGETLESSVDENVTTRVEAHNFIDGVCDQCGYEGKCTHKYTGTRTQSDWSETEELECTPVDDVYHIFRGDLYQETYCLDCGEMLKREVIENGIEGIEEHQFNYGGVCWVCEYESKCTHENTTVGNHYDYASAEIKSFDEDGHTYVFSAMIEYETCEDCGEIVSEHRVEIEPHEETEAHYLRGDSCVDCGYVSTCAHKNTHVETDDGESIVVSSDATGHKIGVHRYTMTICDDCDSVLNVIADAVGRFETAEHSFEDGVCTVCGYKKPVDTEPTMPTVTDAPTMPAVTDAPKATKKPAEATAKPAEPAWTEVTVAEIMTQMDADVAAQGGSIRIVNAEKVLTPDELTALNALPVKEQMLTFLSVIGLEEPVNRALEARQESLSAEAEALNALVLARIAAMDDATREAFDIALLECFPEEAITIDGVVYNFFVIDLEVRTGNGVRYERYGFRREGDEWIFARLEPAK